jgi:hypothetical protein
LANAFDATIAAAATTAAELVDEDIFWGKNEFGIGGM